MIQKNFEEHGSSRNKNSDELDELKEKRDKLKKENELKKNKINEISERIENIGNSILKTTNDIEVYEKRAKDYPDKIETLTIENDSLLDQVNKIRHRINRVKSDEESALLLMDTLMEEYEDLTNDRTDLAKRIKTLHNVIEDLDIEKKQKLPKLKKYDKMLKNAWYEMQETENSMDVSLKLWQRKSNYNRSPSE